MTRADEPDDAPVESSRAWTASYALGGVGVAVVLGSLVFFANRAYRSDASLAERLFVLALVYGLCAAVFAVGRSLAHKDEGRVGYAHALLAGALAGVYYTTYAAHAVAPLRVVLNPLLGLGLLTACATLILWLARQPHVRRVAVLAFLLAAAASLAGRLEIFTLASNAVLAAAAFFLVRNAWRALPLAMVAVTYAALLAWLFFGAGGLEFPLYLGTSAFTRVASLAILYWAIFCTPLLRSPDPELTTERRAAFLALVTAFAVGLLALTAPVSEPRAFSIAMAALAGLLLGLAVGVRRYWAAWTRLDPVARALGFVLLLVSAVALRTGSPLVLGLAVATLTMAMAAEEVASVALRCATVLLGLLAGSLALSPPAAPEASLAAGAVFLAAAFWVERRGEHSPRLNPGTLFLTAVGLGAWMSVVMSQTAEPIRPALLAGLALLLTAAGHLVGLMPMALLGQAFLLAGFATFLAHASTFAGPSWTVAVIVAASLGLGAWWRTLGPRGLAGAGRRVFPALYALGTLLVLGAWMRWRLPAESARAWLVVPAVLAVAACAFARFTGDRPTGVLGLALLVLALAQSWARGTEAPVPEAWAMAVPLAALVAVSLLLPRIPAAVARGLASVMLVLWVRAYVPAPWRFVALEVLAVGLLYWAGTRGRRLEVWLSTVLSTGAAALFWWDAANHRGALVPDLIGFGLLLAQQQLWRKRFPHLVPAALHEPAMVVGIGSLWRWAHLTTAAFVGPAWVGVGWAGAGLAACVLGLRLREPFYRQLGLGILAAALVRVAALGADLPTLARLASLLAIGLLLLGLGFAYGRFRRGLPEARA